MNRRSFMALSAASIAGAAGVLAPGAALAESYQSSVVEQLRGQGYRQINVERTLLGRVRIVAERRGGSREIILNPRTGEILRDVVVAADGRQMPQIADDDDKGKGSSGDDGSDNSGSDDGSDDGGSYNGGSDDSGSGSGDSGDSGDSGSDGNSGSGDDGSGHSGSGSSGSGHDDSGHDDSGHDDSGHDDSGDDD
ncbi:MAG: hypothetical protein JWS10_67 [Cypionkella sp.]|uniref:hypothetical protein n=1 Tax=Cypionkella sp. TaxID=2811411 RepID=UPI00260279EC|nr:hypothetical protein [Cypionkella sp.]MDB5657452.1 hypothetical protein [Cypionkella sp.]